MSQWLVKKALCERNLIASSQAKLVLTIGSFWVLTALLVGCRSKDPESESTTEIPSAPLKESNSFRDPQKPSIPPSEGEFTQEQFSRLFTTGWISNHSATMAYVGNSEMDQEDLKQLAWLWCTEMKVETFFVDAGLMWSTRRNRYESELIELPVYSKEFRSQIRFMDRYHFAYNHGNHWLVFRAADWERDHYVPPTH